MSKVMQKLEEQLFAKGLERIDLDAMAQQMAPQIEEAIKENFKAWLEDQFDLESVLYEEDDDGNTVADLIHRKAAQTIRRALTGR